MKSNNIFTLGLATLAQLSLAVPLTKRTETKEAAGLGFPTNNRASQVEKMALLRQEPALSA